MTEQSFVQQAALCMTFGDSGAGKSTDCGYSFPNALYIAAPGALSSIESTCGFSPTQTDAQDIADAIERINYQLSIGAEYDAIIVDDFSFLHQRELAKWQEKIRGNNFKPFQMANDAVMQFRDTCRYAGMHIVVNCWERKPSTSGGVFKKGGPLLTGKLGEALPAMFDIVLRCGHEPARKPWSGVYHCTSDPNWVTKDRFNIAQTLGVSPMNLGEILRAAGYTISRLPELDWQEEIVQNITTQLLESDGSSSNAVASEWYTRLLEKVDHRIARWTVRDALDRSVIQRGLTSARSSFF